MDAEPAPYLQRRQQILGKARSLDGNGIGAIEPSLKG